MTHTVTLVCTRSIVTLSYMKFLFFILTFRQNEIGERRLKKKGSMRMTIDDDAQH